jgi:hypothetical protein
MSETITVPQQAEPRWSGPADLDVFMQVEKWLAVIRELARDQAKRVRAVHGLTEAYPALAK